MLIFIIFTDIGQNQERQQSNLEKILSKWKSKIKNHLPIMSNIKTKLQSDDIKLLLDRMAFNFGSFWTTSESDPSLLGTQKSKAKKNRLSEFLYNISSYLQKEESNEQEGEARNSLLQQFLQIPVERSPTLPLLKLHDFLVSLRGSQNWSVLLNFLQRVFKSINNSQNARNLLGHNWEMLGGLMDTLFQALLSGTFTRTATLQGVLCFLMGHSNCGLHPVQILKLLLPLEGKNWTPVVNVQSGVSVASHGKYRPFNMLSESLKEKHTNSSRFNPLSEQEEVQNVFDFFYRSKEKESGTKAVDVEGSPEDVVWEVLEDLHYNLMKRMERSVYDNLNRKVSRMKGTLMNRVSSVIGIPHADQNGKCSVGRFYCMYNQYI